MGKQFSGIDPVRLNDYAREIAEVVKLGIQVGIVIGGGNIFRGMSGTTKGIDRVKGDQMGMLATVINRGIDRVKGDQMGMLATVINSLALQSALVSNGTKARVFTSIRMEPVGEYFSKDKAIEAIETGCVVIIAGGTGNPYFTTDTASALRGIEIEADAMFKGTRVDGVYSADPEKVPGAIRFDTISFDEVYRRGLRFMDLTATALCKENNLPVVVFNMDVKGNLMKVVQGEKTGTVVTVS